MSMFRDLLMSTGGGPTLRHLQIGDVIKDKTLYFDFPDDIRTNSYFRQGATNNYFVASYNENQVSPQNSGTNGYTQIYCRVVRNGNFFITIGGVNYDYIQPYQYVSGSLSVNMTELKMSDYPGVNSSSANPIAWLDTNNPAYEHIWIMDE